MPRIKKLTDYTYSPTNPASEDAIRAQIDDAIQEVYDASSRNDATVNLTGAQTIADVKTFTDGIKIPVASAVDNPIRKDTFETHKTSSDHDGRYYTEAEVNALLLANQQGNHLGTWQGRTPVESDPGIQAIVNEHTEQIKKIAINVKDFGAVGDGINDDSIPLRNALNALNALGGGVLNLLPNSTMLMKSAIDKLSLYNGYYAVELFSNITIKGFNTTIKFDDGFTNKQEYGESSGGNGFISENKENIVIDGIVFDYNGVNNTQPVTPLRTYYGFVFVGGQNVTFKNCHFNDNTGNNIVLFKRQNLQSVIQPKHNNAKIIDCYVHSFGSDVVGNSNKADSSAFYSEWEHTYYNNVQITNNLDPTGGRGGIEIHASNQTIENCYFDKCYPAMYIANDYTTSITINQNILNNVVENCHGGVIIWNVGDIDKFKIKDNKIHVKKSPGLLSNPGGIIQFSNSPTWSKISNGLIENNHIYEFTGLIRNTNQITGIGLQTCESVKIIGNKIENISGYGFVILGNSRLKNTCVVEDNEFKDCYMNQDDTSNAFILLNLTGFSADVKIDKNNISENNGLNRYAFNLTWDLVDDVQVKIRNNILVSILEKIGSRASSVYVLPLEIYASNLLGYYADENGVLTQWTRVNTTTANVNQTYNFPIPFVDDKISIMVTNALENLSNVGVVSYTNSTFTLKSNLSNGNYHIRAIGKIY